MTHAELLQNVKALNAVVELHHPVPDINWESATCENCAEKYPCSTIQAVEEQLKCE
jgi:hypothetical protein